MPRITLKETITKEIDIPMEVLYDLIDKLSQEEREIVMNRLRKAPVKLKAFKKDKIESILADFESTDLYQEDFLRDLQDGLRKSSIYNK
ncbi:MAG: hypothetical protein U9N82_09615 [Thermodesulfobacteriota bacterium]|nr:hypothetical protein [Thermodesulfobacteriota bacterium]